jgi:hypothetical protein
MRQQRTSQHQHPAVPQPGIGGGRHGPDRECEQDRDNRDQGQAEPGGYDVVEQRQLADQAHRAVMEQGTAADLHGPAQ